MRRHYPQHRSSYILEFTNASIFNTRKTMDNCPTVNISISCLLGAFVEMFLPIVAKLCTTSQVQTTNMQMQECFDCCGNEFTGLLPHSEG
jgi:hypothetical protein